MTTKQYLEQIERLSCLIENKINECYQLKQLACGLGANVDGERVQTSGGKDRMASIVTKMVDMQSEINEWVETYIEKRQTIIKQIEKMDKLEHYEFLHMKYINLKSYKEIAAEKSWSMSKVFRVQDEALKAFGRKYDIK